MHLLLGLRRLALSILDHAIQVPALVIGSKGERPDALPVITAGPGVPTDHRAASSVHLRTDVTGAGVLVVSTGSAWGAPVEVVATAAATALAAAVAAQAAADAAQGDVDTVNTQLGNLGALIPSQTPDLATGFGQLSSELGNKLATSKLRGGSVIVASGATSGVSSSLGNGWTNKPVIAGPISAWGASSKCVAFITDGVVTVTVDVAPGSNTPFWFIVADVS